MLTMIYIGEPNDVVIEGLENDETGDYINDAVITAEVRTSGDSPTAGDRVGGVFNVEYVSESNGNYRGTFPSLDASELEERTIYYVWITAVATTLRRIECIATYRSKT